MEGPLEGLGRALGALRTERGISAETLARRLGVHVTVLRRREDDDYNPQAAKLSRHLMLLGVGLRELAGALEQVTGKPSPEQPRREPSATSMGMAIEAMPGASEDELREWALAHDDEQEARVRRYAVRRRFDSART